MKKIVIIIIVFIIALAGVSYYILRSDYIGKIVKQQIEKQGSEFLDKNVSVAKVDIDLIAGTSEIDNLSIKDLLSIKDIDIDIDIASLARSVKIINKININGITGTAVLKDNGTFNISHIQKQIQQKLNTEKAKIDSSAKTEATTKQYDPNITIKAINITDIKVKLDLAILNNKTFNISMQKINLRNIGGKNGLPASHIGGIITNEILKQISKNAQSRVAKIIEDKILKKTKDKAKKLLKKLF